MSNKRTPFLKALVGSHNYNLQVPSSDMDYKLFVLPLFEDMFANRDIAKSFTADNGDDVEYKDARQLSYLWWKSNVNFTEVLFSNDLVFSQEVEKHVKKLLDKKEEIARMNLPYLHKSSLGMIRTKLRLAQRNYENGLIRYDENGKQSIVKGISAPWGKEMMGAYRIGDFFMRYYNNGFTDFKAAMTYSDEERVKLLAFKNEEMSYEDALAMVKEKEQELLDVVFTYDEEDGLKTKEFVESVLKEAVMEDLKKRN